MSNTTYERVIRERDDAIALAKKLAECGDPKPWRIQEWQDAKSKLSLPNDQVEARRE